MKRSMLFAACAAMLVFFTGAYSAQAATPTSAATMSLALKGQAEGLVQLVHRRRFRHCHRRWVRRCRWVRRGWRRGRFRRGVRRCWRAPRVRCHGGRRYRRY